MRKIKEIDELGLKTENLSTNPAGVEQILGILIELKKYENDQTYPKVYYSNVISKQVNAEGKTVVSTRSPEYWFDHKVIHSKMMSFMKGLKLIEEMHLDEDEEANIDLGDNKCIRKDGYIVLSDQGKEVFGTDNVMLEELEKLNIRVHTKKGNKAGNPNTEAEWKEFKKNIQSNNRTEEVYENLKKKFLDSPCYKQFEEFMYENCCSVFDIRDLQKVYYRELLLALGIKIREKPDEERTPGSSGSTGGDNNGVSAIDWCLFFDVISVDGNNCVVFDLDVKEIIKRRLEDGSIKQIVFTGAPGTGKTFSVKKYIKEQSEEKAYKFIQFHSGYDYSDFVEGIRPVKGKEKNQFVKLDGVFKKFCRYVVEQNIINVGKGLQDCIDILKKDDSDEEKRKLISEINKKRFYFVIDEINRADLSRVFGELLYGLEDGYRGPENRFDTQYQNLDTYIVDGDDVKVLDEDCFKDGFFIPRNLYIIGTMNDIDRSVDSIDFALRRRFDWCEIQANYVVKKSLKSMHGERPDSKLDKLAANIINMNLIISGDDDGLLGREYHIGPAYFKKYNVELDNITEIFNTNIRTLLREYLRGRDYSEVESIINACYESLINVQNVEIEDDSEDDSGETDV